jgi:hypothetical protein
MHAVAVVYSCCHSSAFSLEGLCPTKAFPWHTCLFLQTDTASVLQETIGYIRFLLGQIEVYNLSLSLSLVCSVRLVRGKKAHGSWSYDLQKEIWAIRECTPQVSMGFCTCSHGCGKVAVPESTFTEHWGRREVSQYYSGSTRPANKKGRNMRAWGGGGAGCKSTLLKLWRALLLLHGRARTHTAAAA